MTGLNISLPTVSGPIEGTFDDDFIFGQSGGIVSAEISLLAGNDRVVGRNIFENGIGINQSVVDGGSDNDIIIGLGTGVNGVGIIGGAFDGGGGDDLFIARGDNVGVIDVAMNGGGGDDRFVIERGTGAISGSSGEDTLVLPGMSSDYEIIPIDDLFDVIEVKGADTDLFLDQIEVLGFVDSATGMTETIFVDDLFA